MLPVSDTFRLQAVFFAKKRKKCYKNWGNATNVYF